MSEPLVSICVPTYNRASALREGLRSIQGQDYAPLEILISDNGSADETEAVCRQAALADSRIRYVRHPHNQGLYRNHNFCIDESHGEFICFFHDHDERSLRLVSEYVSFLSHHPEVGVVCSDWELISDAGECLGVRECDVPSVTPGLEYIERTMRSGRSSIGIPGAMIRRTALGDIRFDEQGPIGFGDFVVWFQIAERWQIGHVDRLLWRCRQLRQSQSARTIVSMARDYEECLSRYCDAHVTRWPAHAQMVSRWRSSVNRYLFWALAYELALYCRNQDSRASKRPAAQTLFEILDYRLSAEEFQQVLQQLEASRTGFVQHGIFVMLNVLMRLKLTGPLVWATHHQASLRSLLGLR